MSTPSRNYRSAPNRMIAAIADIWQFWLDADMNLIIILPPDTRDFADFPCGINAIGRPLFDLVSIEHNATAAVEFYNGFRAQEKIQNVKFVRPGDSGAEITMLISGAPHFAEDGGFEGYQCTVSDVSSVAGRAGNDTGDYEAILGAFIRHVPNMVVMKDVEGRFMAVNPLAERTYGVSHGKLVGRHAAEVLPPEFAEECCKEDNAVLESETVRETEQTFAAPDGARVFHTVKFPIFDADRYLVGTGAIGVDITQYRRIEDGLYQRANFDLVTGMPNRRLMRDRLTQVLALSKRTKTMAGAITLDLGDFTALNEAMGHVGADWLLIDVAATLREICRETDIIGRMDGDVFTVVVSNLASADQLELVADKILATLKRPRVLGDESVYIQPSIGTALFPNDARHSDELLHCAKMALDQAKQGGRSRIVRFRASLSDIFARRMKIQSNLRQAVDRQELSLAYQPIMDLRSGKIAGVEALLRWTSAELGQVGPDEFIPVAEEAGLIDGIGAWVLKEACATAKILNRDGADPITVSVNVSVKQIAGRNVAEMVEEYLRDLGLAPNLLKIEMTESAFASDIPMYQTAIEDFRTLGLGVALDDFGTGYSSLSYLHRYRFHQLKIDKSFIDNITARGDGYVLVENIIRMAHSLRLEVVAEGVESDAQIEILRTLGCDLLQGYRLSKPVPANDLTIAFAKISDEFASVA
ncbi:MAG: putative bifunctional diguanylate cyclase/phosphodiesterase [Rhodospirillaceae bacterium]